LNKLLVISYQLLDRFSPSSLLFGAFFNLITSEMNDGFIDIDSIIADVFGEIWSLYTCFTSNNLITTKLQLIQNYN
jgi:hypothetical protein